MLTRICLLIVAAALLMAPAVAVAGPPPRAPAALGAEAGELQHVIDDLVHRGLPGDLVESKLREGLAKGIAPARIATTARALARRIELVALIVHKRSPRGRHNLPVIRAGVAAHTAGVPLPDIDRLLAGASRRGRASMTVGLYAAGDLVGRGYPKRDSVELVLVLLGRATHREELPRALAAVEAARRALGVAPAAALAHIAAAVGAGASLTAALAALDAARPTP